MASGLSRKPELLAPAGSMESLKAAIQNGCDAVYLGGKAFGARASATNFTLEELEEALQYAHLYGVRIYLTVNTLYKDAELESLLEFINEVYLLGIDGVILQDLGVARLIQQNWPDLEIHASTQMTVHNLEGVRYLADLGFKRVVLARELTLEEIRAITAESPVEVETFIHGALCVCYSGQCLMSSLIGGRSGNRGRCAQPCRLPYQLVDREVGEVLAVDAEPRYLLSPKDICTLEILPELVQAGICSFKIEGRLKRPEYAAAVSRVYRKYLDLAFENSDGYRVAREDLHELLQIFNRGGFSTGYYQGKSGSSMMSFGRPKNWGVKIGEVISYDRRSNICQIRLMGELEEGDGVEIWTGEEENPGTIVSSLRIAGKTATFPIKGSIEEGNPVYRTSQRKLLVELSQSYGNFQRKIDIFGQIRLSPGEMIDLRLWDQDGNYIQVQSTEPVAPAEKQPVTVEKVTDQVSKLGSSPYRLADLHVEMEGDVFLPISQLNALRRTAVDELTRKRMERFHLPDSAKEVARDICFPEPRGKEVDLAGMSARPILAVYLNGENFNPENYIELGIRRLYLNLARLTPARVHELKALTAEKIELFAVLPRISRKAEMEKVIAWLKQMEDSELDGFLLANLGEAYLLKDSSRRKIVDFPLNIFNRLTVDYWEETGVEGVTISPELNLREMEELIQWGNVEKEAIVYGYLPAMITEYCPVGAVEGGMTAQKSCTAPRKAMYGLLDRMGHIFPILKDCQNCRSTILNPQPLFLLEQLEQIARTGQPGRGLAVLRMDLTLENEVDAIELVGAYLKRLNNPTERLTPAMVKLVEKMQARGFTKGHFYRGVE